MVTDGTNGTMHYCPMKGREVWWPLGQRLCVFCGGEV
jgi:hypothetical protein